jgi:hypothetical protein
MFSGPIIVNTGFDKAKANAVLTFDDADRVAFGVPLNKPNPSTFYGDAPEG